MQLDQTFEVPVPVDQAWAVLLDLHRIAPCLPGAMLTEVAGDTFAGTVKVKLGPIGLTYSGKGRFVERDEAARRMVIEASGRDTRSAGTAAATVTAVLSDLGGATKVEVSTDLKITGKPAQFGRSMIADVSAKLLGQFATCLAETLATPAAAPVVTDGPAERAVETPGPVEVHEAEAVDLLRLTGSTATARRVAAYGLVGLLAAALAWLALRRLRRALTPPTA